MSRIAGGGGGPVWGFVGLPLLLMFLFLRSVCLFVCSSHPPFPLLACLATPRGKSGAEKKTYGYMNNFFGIVPGKGGGQNS